MTENQKAYLGVLAKIAALKAHAIAAANDLTVPLPDPGCDELFDELDTIWYAMNPFDNQEVCKLIEGGAIVPDLYLIRTCEDLYSVYEGSGLTKEKQKRLMQSGKTLYRITYRRDLIEVKG